MKQTTLVAKTKEDQRTTQIRKLNDALAAAAEKKKRAAKRIFNRSAHEEEKVVNLLYAN